MMIMLRAVGAFVAPGLLAFAAFLALMWIDLSMIPVGRNVNLGPIVLLDVGIVAAGYFLFRRVRARGFRGALPSRQVVQKTVLILALLAAGFGGLWLIASAARGPAPRYPALFEGSPAPPIFDYLAVVIILIGIGIFVALGARAGRLQSQNPGRDHFYNIAASIAGLVLALYVLYAAATGVGGFGALFLFLSRATSTPQPWTVWLTLAAWALLAALSVWTLCRLLAIPLPPRSALPVGKFLIGLILFGGLWWFGVFVPTSWGWGRWALLLNLLIQFIYVAMIAEDAGGLALLLLAGRRQ